MTNAFNDFIFNGKLIDDIDLPRLGHKIGGVDVVGASLGNLSQYGPAQRLLAQNPATSADWTMAEAASEFGVIAEAAA